MTLNFDAGIMSAGGKSIIKSKTTPTMIVVYDSDDKVVCVAVGKDGFFTKYKWQVYTPTPAYAKQPPDEKVKLEDGSPCYLFATSAFTYGMGGGSGAYSIIKEDADGDPVEVKLYDYSRPGGMKLAMAVVNVQGTVVAKLLQEKTWQPNMITGEIGAHVDPVPIFLMTAFVNAISKKMGGVGAGIAAGV